MATVRFETNAAITKQVLVDYTANSLAPYTLLDCICGLGEDDDTAGMNLIYNYINKDIANSTAITSLAKNEGSTQGGKYLLVWDDEAEYNTYNTPKFRRLSLGPDSTGSSTGKDAATSIFGQDGNFHDRVKYAEGLYKNNITNYSAESGIYVPYLNITNNGDQLTSYLKSKQPARNGEVLALVYNGNTLDWGSAGAILHNVASDSNASNIAFKLVGTNLTESVDSAPSTLYYHSNVYFKNGNLYHASDETLKTFTGDIDINLDNLATIKKGMFYWKSDPDKVSNIGVSAQSVEALYPELVTSDKGLLSVDYAKLSVVALAAIDKLNERIKELEKQIDELKK